jgi:Ca2+-binding EF-hand superfamily protein
MLIPILLLTGVATFGVPPISAAQPPAAPHRHAGRPFISPMGEPFAVRGEGDDTLVDWFQQADGNHDGSLSVAEMQLDADRFFALLDTNHDGEIDPDEITNYEEVIAPQHFSASDRPAVVDRADPSLDGGRSGHRGGGGHGGGRGHGGWVGGGGGNANAPQGRARYGLLDLPEPVAAADADLSRGITREEFRSAALLRFQALDVDHQGRLTLNVLESLRPPSPAHAKKDPDAPSGPDANADTGG